MELKPVLEMRLMGEQTSVPVLLSSVGQIDSGQCKMLGRDGAGGECKPY